MLWDAKKFVTGQDKALINTFFLIHLIFLSNLRLKITDLKGTNVDVIPLFLFGDIPLLGGNNVDTKK
jgi:hypothetical protein